MIWNTFCKSLKITIIVLFLTCSNVLVSFAEQNATQVMGGNNTEIPGLNPNEIVFLKASDGGDEFLTLFIPGRRMPSYAGILLLHNNDAHPNQPGLIETLRTQLPDRGFSTLSIMLAPLDAGATKNTLSAQVVQGPNKSTPATAATEDKATFSEAEKAFNARLLSGLNYFKEQKCDSIFLVAHGTSALFAINFLKTNTAPSVKGVIVISTIPLDPQQSMEEAGLFLDLKIPCLDIYGSLDWPNIRQSAQLRQHLIKQYLEKNKNYKQKRLEGASLNYHGYHEELVKLIHHWTLNSLKSNEPKV